MAQWAVVDVGAIAQLLQQYETLKQQLTTAENSLSQAQAQYQSITGGRGMQNLLSGTNRNYLPSDWSQIVAAINRTGSGFNFPYRQRHLDLAADGGATTGTAQPSAGRSKLGGNPTGGIPTSAYHDQQPLRVASTTDQHDRLCVR
jgi:hypothetical protein